MDVDACQTEAAAVWAKLPDHVREVLARVEIHVVATAADDGPPDMKGAFSGFAGRDDDDVDEDEDPDADEPCLPEGEITLVASAIADPAELAVVLLHEISHALGFDETATALLGLGEVHDAHGPDPTA